MQVSSSFSFLFNFIHPVRQPQETLVTKICYCYHNHQKGEKQKHPPDNGSHFLFKRNNYSLANKEVAATAYFLDKRTQTCSLEICCTSSTRPRLFLRFGRCLSASGSFCFERVVKKRLVSPAVLNQQIVFHMHVKYYHTNNCNKLKQMNVEFSLPLYPQADA